MQTDGRRQFRIGRCLGRGGFGEVYRATMRSPGSDLETVVALKVLRADLGLQAEAVRRLRDEGKLLKRIVHPAVVRAHDLIRVEGRLALVTEFVEGLDLDDLIDGPAHIPPRALLEVVAQLAVALATAYATPGADGAPLAVVHRDLKPTNVRIGRHGQVKLLDFGIARFSAGDRESQTASDVIVGSLPYMAPERFVERQALPASDVFGLGCLLFEGLAQQRFHPEGQLRTLSAMSIAPDRYARHLEERLATLTCGEPLLGHVRACLAFDPAARPAARDLATALEALAEATPGPSLRRWCADRTWEERPKVDGELEGRMLTEGTLGVPADPDPDADPGADRRPVVVSKPLGTIDPSVFDDGPAADPAPPRASPRAPSAFPSVPMVAIEEELAALRPPRRSAMPLVVGAIGCVGVAALGWSAVLAVTVLVTVWLTR